MSIDVLDFECFGIKIVKNIGVYKNEQTVG